MATIRVPSIVCRLAFYPQSESGQRQTSSDRSPGQRLHPRDLGLMTPSFWTDAEIRHAFDGANQIWLRGADIEFSPVRISERSEVVPADRRGMWTHLVNNLSPPGRGITVCFVYDLPSDGDAVHGGRGGGRIAAISGRAIVGGFAGFSASLLAHELGHLLGLGDRNQPMNLMHYQRHPRKGHADLLENSQRRLARERAEALT